MTRLDELDVNFLLLRIERLKAANVMSEALRNAALLLRADIACCNGCGCEEYDYCAADEWDDLIVKDRVQNG